MIRFSIFLLILSSYLYLILNMAGSGYIASKFSIFSIIFSRLVHFWRSLNLLNWLLGKSSFLSCLRMLLIIKWNKLFFIYFHSKILLFWYHRVQMIFQNENICFPFRCFLYIIWTGLLTFYPFIILSSQ